MEKDEITEALRFYPKGTVLNISWDRGNGELSRDYVLLGFEENTPILKLYEEGRKIVKDYSEVTTFNIFNPDLSISNLEVIAHKSVEFLATTD